MASSPALHDAPLAASAGNTTFATIHSYLELTKPRITVMILVSGAVGFWFGSDRSMSLSVLPRLVNALLGLALIASGTAALNQWWERASDALMRRTANRPIPSGRINAHGALRFGISLAVIGFFDLAISVNWISAWLCLLTLLTYLLIYTPLKQKSTLCTTVGAFPGSMPPLIGCAAARGRVGVEALVLGAILLLWQFPHFYAIAWMYRDDYARGHMRMLPVAEPDCDSTARRMIIFAALLIPLSMLPSYLGMTNRTYAVAAALMGLWYLKSTIAASRTRTPRAVRSVLMRSVAYLPVLYSLMVACS